MLSQLTSYFFMLAACCGMFFATMSTPTHAQDNLLTASVDRNSISVQETLTLRVRYSGPTSAGQPDFSQIEAHFDIIAQQRSNQMSAINGVVNSFTEWTLTLAPKQEGQLLIPSFKFDGHFSDAIQINVTKASAPPGQLRDIFIETTVDNTQIYVQQQLVVTYRLHTTRSIDSIDAEAIKISGVSMEQLSQTRYQKQLGGITYDVLEASYALFPQQSESFTIPSLQWTLRVVTSPSRRSFGFGANRYELMRLNTDEKTIEVKPRPSTYPANKTWLPAKNLELREEWGGSPTDFRVGEPISRTISLQAQGLTAAQLPPLPLEQNPQGYKLYPDQPEQSNHADAQGITGTRTETMAIVPSRAGELILPAIEVTWWDTETDRLQKAELPEQIIYVQAADGSKPPATPESDAPPARENNDTAMDADAPPIGPTNSPEDTGSFIWPLLTGLFGLLWLTFLGLWWRARHISQANAVTVAENRSASNSNEKRAFRELEKIANATDPAGLRRGLLHWGASRWPEHPPRSLQELSKLVEDGKVREQLTKLDAALYSDSEPATPLDALELVTGLQNWRRQTKVSASPQQRLKPLY